MERLKTNFCTLDLLLYSNFKICIKFPDLGGIQEIVHQILTGAFHSDPHLGLPLQISLHLQQRRQHMNKRFSTQTTFTSALFMNPAFMPPA
ncbi:BEM_collapsed_G0016630.mRNA.1.CDS.1 [Saccharomyces cerevisiae]|nr:BEM_collapsed_G0016630.mRNA.1.CDS.1 [Saccharomyces cerevisiae]